MQSSNPAEVASFSARKDCFGDFKHCYNFGSLQLLSDALSTHEKAPKGISTSDIQVN